jgi:hypothetical protein
MESEIQPKPSYGRITLTNVDWSIAGLLFIATLGILLATATMGTTRDESFYFRYAVIYQEWFERVGGDSNATGQATEPLGRKDVVDTWSQNFEHPPLMKMLFGFSWRFFADKKRPILISLDGDTQRLEARELGAADGFTVGDTVVIYGPQSVNKEAVQKEPRTLGTATVARRDVGSARLEYDGDITSLAAQCSPNKPDDKKAPRLHGCRVGSSGSTQWLSEITAMRLPGQVFAAILISVLFLFGTELFGRWAGLFAALSFLCTPRHFFHAHLSCFDIPVTALIIATVWAYWRSLHHPRWVGITAILWGLGLLTKLNAFFIPIPLLIAWLLPGGWKWVLARVSEWRAGKINTNIQSRALRALKLDFQIAFPPVPRAFLWMPPIGIAMLFTCWPRLWYDPIGAFGSYVGFHLKHVHYLQQYFGMILSAPPFPIDFPWVMTLVTVPVPFLLLGVLGLWRLIQAESKRTSTELKVLLLANMCFPIVLISLPTTPIFGGIKHWMASLAFLGLAGGLGFQWLISSLSQHIRPIRTVLTTAALATILSSGAYASLKYRDHGTSYYNELAGGIQGAADLQMHRQFWGYSSRLAFDWINAEAPKNATIAFHNTTYDSFYWYQRDGLLREDLRWRRDPQRRCRGEEIYVFHHQESFAQERLEASSRLKTDTPSVVFSVDNVPVISIFKCGVPAQSVRK